MELMKVNLQLSVKVKIHKLKQLLVEHMSSTSTQITTHSTSQTQLKLLLMNGHKLS